MAVQTNADRALKALSSEIFSVDFLEALSGLLPENSNDTLELALLRTLIKSHDPRLKNASALALTDIRSVIVPLVIRGLIQAPELRSSLATLLYALRIMNGTLSLGMIVTTIVNASEEAQEELLTFLQEKLVDSFSESDRTDAKNYLCFTAINKDSILKKEVRQNAINFIDELTHK